jgi:hypothetical protein
MNIEKSGRRHIVHKSLGEGLMLKNEDGIYYMFRDEKTGLEYLRHSRGLWNDGFHVSLGAYKCHVFSSFTELRDFDGNCRRLDEILQGRGVPDMMTMLRELHYEKVLQPFKTLAGAESLRELLDKGRKTGAVASEFKEKLASFFRSAREFLGASDSDSAVTDETVSLLETLFGLDRIRIKKGKKNKPLAYLFSWIPEAVPKDMDGWRIPLMFALVSGLGELSESDDSGRMARGLLDEWLLGKAIADVFCSMGVERGRAGYEVLIIKILTKYQELTDISDAKEIRSGFKEMMNDDEVRNFLGFNLFEGKWWFNKESMVLLIYWVSLAMSLRRLSGKRLPESKANKVLESVFDTAQELLNIVAESGYEVSKLIKLLEDRR